MRQVTILVIDDSSTIRRLVDSQLSQAGYNVVLAPTAEDGLRLADECRPDMILLDHQLPGTTGYEVCRQLLAADELRRIPVVVSSTLRKKAYAEYTELPNVVDMLPKPFTPELLKTTVANALDTGAMIVNSQSQGTAVPETIEQFGDAALSGSLGGFTLREVLDFLNNGGKHGVLEVESQRERVRFCLQDGRIQAVTAAGVDPQVIAETLPAALGELAPVLNFTAGGRFCSEVDGLVQLLDNKVLDPRLLRSLLRHQAAVLTWRCFGQDLKSFRFEAGKGSPPLLNRLPLEVSLLALLVDGALLHPETPRASADNCVYVRRAVRGQNLDRAGLSARHMKLLGLLGDPVTADDLASRLGWQPDEVRGVLRGLLHADLAERQVAAETCTVFALEPDAEEARRLQSVFADFASGSTTRVVRDLLAMKLLLRRSAPDVLFVDLDAPENRAFVRDLQAADDAVLRKVRWIGAASEEALAEVDESAFDRLLSRPFGDTELLECLQSLHDSSVPAGGVLAAAGHSA
jgi:CheY-like chemotaxis protein